MRTPRTSRTSTTVAAPTRTTTTPRTRVVGSAPYMCRVNPDPVMQGRRGSPAERRKCALTAPDTSAESHCSAPLSALADISSILNAVHKLERSSGWKTGVQRITTDCLCFAIILRRQILTGTYRQQEENIFTVCERGTQKTHQGARAGGHGIAA